MNKNTKRKVAAGTVAALAVAGGGAAIGATQFSSPKEESQAVINDAAQQLGVSPSKLTDALKKALENRVDAAVAAGAMTKAQGDALKAQIESGDNLPLILPGVGRARGFDGFGFGLGPAIKAVGAISAAAADYLGITEAELRTELAGGKTLAQIATAHGKTADGLVQALYDATKKQVDAAVSSGRLTQAQADAILAEAKEHLSDVVNGNAPFRVGPDLPHAFGASLDAAATYLGITEAQLRTELAGGKTLAEVAKAHGKTADGLAQAIYDAQKKQVDAAVAAGKLTQAEADTILADLKTTITAVVNGTLPPLRHDLLPGLRGFGFRHFGFRDSRGFPSFRGAPPAPSAPAPRTGTI